MSLSVSASRERILIHNLNKPRQGATEYFGKNRDSILSKLLETFSDEDVRTEDTESECNCLQE